jgi:3-methylfumaryl-CoA hydratase
LQTWIGRTAVAQDQVTQAPVRALAATLDRNELSLSAGETIPPCWHWLYFLPADRQSEIGPDGHPKRGGFLPPVPLPRRMWAGSQIEFHRPVTVGQSIERQSRIEDVRMKEGRSGPLVFVKVLHEVRSASLLAISERHDIVYRGMPTPPDESSAADRQAPAEAMWTQQIDPDDVLLFRYSALTFNGHRIHYDRRYAAAVEGYPGLVVHGPLVATLLLELLHRKIPQARVQRFDFRAVKPLFDTAPFQVCGRPEGDRQVKLWARTPDGHLAMEASATLG